MNPIEHIQIRRRIRSIVMATLPLLYAGIFMAQTDTEIDRWWSPAVDGYRENGKFTELAGRKKVYVATSFTDARTISEPSATHSSDVHRVVMDAITAHKDVQVVALPSQADFAIRVRAVATSESGERPPNFSFNLDPSTSIAVEVLVTIPGAKQNDGFVRSRVVWESSVANAQVEAQAAARSAVDAFMWQLSKLNQHEASKSKAKK